MLRSDFASRGNAFSVLFAAALILFLAACGKSDEPLTPGNGPTGGGEFRVGGMLSGLAGNGLMLALNDRHTLVLEANGSFRFPDALEDGSAYTVSIVSQPKNLSQTCNITAGSGTLAGADVDEVDIVCRTNEFAIGGTLSGLASSGLALRLNDGEPFLLYMNTGFSFPETLEDGSPYVIAIASQPTDLSQTCSVAPSSGTLAGKHVFDIMVTCETNTFAVGGLVSGLVGSGLTLKLNDGQLLPIGSDGSFHFPEGVIDGEGYTVTVDTNPTDLSQTCSVTEGSGILAGRDIENIAISCKTNNFLVGGTVSGLAGTGLELRLNDDQALSIDSSGSFEFPKGVTDGEQYIVTVGANPTNLSQTCSVTAGTGTLAGEDIDNIDVGCETNNYLVGVTVSGLAGSGLTLTLNDGQLLSIDKNGAFHFSDALEDGSSYGLSIASQPTNLNQTCSLTVGSGTLTGADADIGVVCETDTFAVGGTVTGLAGGGLTLKLNDGQPFSIDKDGNFQFPEGVADGEEYTVTVATNPTGLSQTCSIASGSGTVASADINSVRVSCETNNYRVGGTVSGLAGTGLSLQLNGGQPLSIYSDGLFEFPERVTDGEQYSVSVDANPTGLSQTCSVTAGSGTLAGADVSSISISCKTNSFTVGGMVSGLAGSGLGLKLNDGQPLSIGSNGSFQFPDAVVDGEEYTVTVATQPTGLSQTCSVSAGSGTLAGADINSIGVSCKTSNFLVGGTVSGLAGTGLILQLNGGQPLSINSDGPFQFSSALEDGSAYTVSVVSHPTSLSQTCSVTAGSGALAGTNVDDIAVTCENKEYSVEGTVSDLKGLGLRLGLNGQVLLLDAGETTFAFTKPGPDGSTVEFLSQPLYPHQQCEIVGHTGTLDGEDIADLEITCSDLIPLQGVSDIMQLHLHWDAGGAEVDILYASEPDCDWEQIQSCNDGGVIENVQGDTLTLSAVDDGFDTDTTWYFVVRDGLRSSHATAAKAAVPTMNGPVIASVVKDDRLIVGGRFTHVGLPTGGGAMVTSSGGDPLGVIPHVAGEVLSVVPDGMGGWYIGGDFASVGGKTRNNLARITSDGDVDRNWNPGTNGPVRALVVRAGRIYAGGDFTQAGGRSRSRLAAFDGVTGEVDLGWSPGVNSAVHALVYFDERIYAGGTFTEAENESRGRLAAFDAQTGAVALNWSPKVNAEVHALAALNGRIYAGGNFNQVNGVILREHLAAFDAETGELDTTWNPGTVSTVYALTTLDNRIFAGGYFTQAGGQGRMNLAAFDSVTGHLDADWKPSANATVRTLVASNDRVYAGGEFTKVKNDILELDDIKRFHAAAFDATTGDLDTEWNPGIADKPSGSPFMVKALAIWGEQFYIGGNFQESGGHERKGLAVFDAETGELGPDWIPTVATYADGVEALALSNDRLYVAGLLDIGAKRRRLYALDAETGAFNAAWNPGITSGVRGLAVTGTRVYAVGEFTKVGNHVQNYLAAFDALTGDLDLDWYPTPGVDGVNEGVFALGDRIYVGGRFGEAGGQPRDRLAAFDAETGELDTVWNPGSNNDASVFAVSNNRLLVGGFYGRIAGKARGYLAALDPITGELIESWGQSTPNNKVSTIAVTDERVYVGGNFTRIGSQAQGYFAVLDSDNGELDLDWSPSFNGSVDTISVSGNRVYVGGDFREIDGKGRGGLAVFDLQTGKLLW